MNYSALLRLMRFDKPIGIVLLGSPVIWALWLANQEAPPLKLLLLFLCATIVMRAAGCVVNDLADRHIDGHVKRTQHRPLARGEISVSQALVLLFILLLAALLIVIQLPLICFYYALLALSLTAIYPFCKRFINSPQVVLSLAFSLAIPMAFAASGASHDPRQWLLLLINIAWVIVYDTQYAMADREDDLRIGVRSTAILFAQYDSLIIGLLQLFFHLLWLPLGSGLLFWPGWFAAIPVLIYQQYLIQSREAEDCIEAFRSNGWYGVIMSLALTM